MTENKRKKNQKNRKTEGEGNHDRKCTSNPLSHLNLLKLFPHPQNTITTILKQTHLLTLPDTNPATYSVIKFF